MNLRKIAAATGALALVTTTAALGGYIQPLPVDVDLKARMAIGDQVSARYADNKIELIGCGIRKQQDGAGGIYTFGFCQATDAENDAIYCFTDDPDLLDAISSSGDFGFISFNWNKEEECTRIGFSNQSFYLPKGLGKNF